MKQVTGSNPSRSVMKVSIRLASDGHSFSISGDGAVAAAAEEVEVELLTACSLLVPAALCAEGDGARLLAAAGMPVRSGDEVVCTPPTAGDDPLRAVMALPRDAAEALCGRLGIAMPPRTAAGEGASSPGIPGVRFASPLLHEVAGPEKCVWIRPAGELLYIKVCDGRLRLAEVFSVPSVDDALCLLDRLAGVFPLSDLPLLLAGAEGEKWRKTMKRYFKQIVCES